MTSIIFVYFRKIKIKIHSRKYSGGLSLFTPVGPLNTTVVDVKVVEIFEDQLAFVTLMVVEIVVDVKMSELKVFVEIVVVIGKKVLFNCVELE